MAGHSKFKNIMHRKGGQDAKRAKIFTKIGREITTAAKLGHPDPAMNPRLRAAIAKARLENMPNDRIKSAIAKALPGADSANYDEVRYEGYAPGGIAIIVDALTDNRNRTAGEVRSTFAKNEGNMGESNSVSFMFDRVGSLFYPKTVASDEVMFEAALEAGAQNVDSSQDGHDVTTNVDDFSVVRDTLEKKFGEAEKSGLIWRPNLVVPLSADNAQDVLDLIEELEDLDDVQTVTANFEMSDEIMSRLTAQG